MLEAAQRSSGFVRDVASQTVPTAGIAAPTPLKGGLQKFTTGVCTSFCVCPAIVCGGSSIRMGRREKLLVQSPEGSIPTGSSSAFGLT